MASLEERVRSSQRRGSAVEIMDNPLAKGASALSSSKKIETVVDTKPISKMDVIGLVEKYIAIGEDYKKILEELEIDKQPYTFDCDDLLILMGCTTSVRTKLSMVLAIAPRLVNPKAKMDIIINSFRFAEEKEAVDEALRARIQVLNGTLFKKKMLTQARGGRGSAALVHGGRGSGKYWTSTRSKDSDDDDDEEDVFMPEKTSATSTGTAEGESEQTEHHEEDHVVVDVHEIYGRTLTEEELLAQAARLEANEEEFFEDDEPDSDDEVPEAEAENVPAPQIQESITTSVFKAFSYFSSGSK